MNNIIPMDYEGLPVRFNSDGWIDATGIAATVLSAEEVASFVDDVHYMDLDDAAAEQALRNAIDERAADAALDAADALDAPVAAYTAPAGTNPIDLSTSHFDLGESTAEAAPAAARPSASRTRNRSRASRRRSPIELGFAHGGVGIDVLLPEAEVLGDFGVGV
ncbi:hypothetical protein D9M68_345780 [compost metagenome]